MKCQLVGFNRYSFVKDEKEVNALSLHFLRKPNLSEVSHTGSVVFTVSVFDEAIPRLPELKVDSLYSVEVNSYKQFHKLLDMQIIEK